MNVDIAIVILFLSFNLAAGFYSGRGVNTITDYALGGRNFNTATIVTTIIATWVGAGFFSIAISQTYQDGIWFIVTGLGDIIAMLIVGFVLAPRMKSFLGSLSVAETMGTLYGKHVRIISALASISISIGAISLQIKVLSTLFNYFLDISSVYAVVFSSIIIIVYSTFGGIKAVTFTDTIQFLTFGIFAPIFVIFIWKAIGDYDAIINTLKYSPQFDYRELLNTQNPKFWPYFTLFTYYMVPALDPAIFQRTLMAKNTAQIRQSFGIAAFFLLLIFLVICSIGIVIYSHNPNLEPNNLIMYIVDHYSYPGLKGLVLIGIMAMIMSTADSYINSASVIFSHDLCTPLGIQPFKSELVLSRIFAVVGGSFAVVLALYTNNLLDLLLLIGNFYIPIIIPPLILAILGFRTTPKIALMAIGSGIFTVFIWRTYLQDTTGVESVMPGMLANLIVLLFGHYIFKEPGGWVKPVKDEESEQSYKKKSLSQNVSKFLTNSSNNISNFNLLKHCNLRLPKQQRIYSYFAYGVLTTLITTFSLDKSIYQQYAVLINSLQGVALFISMIFICYNLWPVALKERYTGVIWYSSIFIALAFIGSFLVLISKFSQISLVIFILNLTMIGMLLNWQTTFLMMASGAGLAVALYQYYIGEPTGISSELYDLKIQIVYIILLISGFMLAFLKPKQEQQELTEERADHLAGRIGYQANELEKALNLKNEFIRNVTHEYHAPMTGVISMAETLWESYDKLPEKYRKAAIETIYKSAIRLDSYDNNIRELSELSSPEAELNIEPVHFNSLVQHSLKTCIKLYLNDQTKKNYQFITNLNESILVDCDAYYLTQTLDNLIINAISYCKKGTITLSLTKKANLVEFSITDEGIGIPTEDLYDIFGSFTVSSKTKTSAGGRGIGLALCKKVIEMHQGKIWAESENGKTNFSFSLPIKSIRDSKLASNEAINIAENLISNGIDSKIISKATGLSKKQIEGLKAKK